MCPKTKEERKRLETKLTQVVAKLQKRSKPKRETEEALLRRIFGVPESYKSHYKSGFVYSPYIPVYRSCL